MTIKNHEAKNFDHLIGNLKTLSERQLTVHFELYRGYVGKYNEIQQMLTETDPSKSNYSFGIFSELKRREAVPMNGTYLHELYFENLNPTGTEPDPEFKRDIEKNFGDWNRFMAHSIGTGMTGPGWSVLTRDRTNERLHNIFIMEHHRGFPVNHDVLLVLDSWEHAFMIDHGNGRKAYLQSLLDNDVSWDTVNKRYRQACETPSIGGGMRR